MRIGSGHDTHRLVSGRKLILGGIQVEAPFGPQAHSDGDVLLHAIIDALLGAAGLGDIGELFPPSDDRWKDADSIYLLSIVLGKLADEGLTPVHIDSTIHLEKPSLRTIKPQIREKLSEILPLHTSRISVKAKSGEGLGPIGRGEAVAADAVVLLEELEQDSWV